MTRSPFEYGGTATDKNGKPIDAQGNLMPNPNPSQATPNGATDDLSNSVFLIIVMLVANPGRLNHRASV
jgi:hypothetical protein